MKIAIRKHVSWPLFNAIAKKQLLQYNEFPCDNEIIQKAFDSFFNKGSYH